MSGIEVQRSIYIEQDDMLIEAAVHDVGYISNDENVMMQSLVFGQQREYYYRVRHIAEVRETIPGAIIQRSPDNGRTWDTVEAWRRYHPLGGDRRLDTWTPTPVLNPKTGALLRLYMGWEDRAGRLPWDKDSPVRTTGRLFIQASNDQGLTWSEPTQLVFEGDVYDATHWGPGLWYGRNRGVIVGNGLIMLDDGRFLIPFSTTKPDDLNDPQAGKSQSSCLIGRWRGDGIDVAWEMTSYATLPGEFSVDGGVEPCAAVLRDGRLIMMMRARYFPNHGVTTPSGRYYVVSSDVGRTWSEPRPLHYDDDTHVYNPACLARLLRSSKNGRLYLITNFVAGPAINCDPRTTLQIAQLDEDQIRVLRDTVTIIETRTPDQPQTIRFSNWAQYEDRETENLVLFMTHCPGNEGRHETCGAAPHSYRYDVILPE